VTPAPTPAGHGLHARDSAALWGGDAPSWPGVRRLPWVDAGFAGADASTPVEAGTLEIAVSVTVTYRAL
jgi:hypothetical protein